MGRAIGGSAKKAHRLAEAQGVDDVDGHALAGFIEAEASFAIRPNNGGRSWVCGMTLTQRDDDADMLADLVRVTGLGRLHWRPAQRSSRPQVCWSVRSKLECRQLVRLLQRYPLRGRKRREVAVWAVAVDRWAQSLYGAGDAATHRILRESADELRALRGYVDKVDGPVVRDHRSEALIAFLGGFFTGEGSFSLDGRAAACIHLRADDADLLRTFQRRFGIGRVAFSTAAGRNPSVRWTVCRRAELPRAIALFEAAVLRGRKRREFEAWRVGAAEYARGRVRDAAVVSAARAALGHARSYVPRAPRLEDQASAIDSYVRVVRALAAEEHGEKLTSTTYQRARERHPEWPTRNTIAMAFGSWANALDAAGLGSRVTDWARDRAR